MNYINCLTSLNL